MEEVWASMGRVEGEGDVVGEVMGEVVGEVGATVEFEGAAKGSG